MAMQAYLKMKGQKSGEVKGSITQKGRENTIGVIEIEHGIVSPRDPQTGMPTGQRTHKPFVFTKELDKSSPILYNMICTNENITEAVFHFYTPQVKAATGVGSEVQHYTVKLTNANIAEITFTLGNIRDPELVKRPEYEKVSLTYQKIEWTWNDGGVTAGDDWEHRH